MFILKRFSVRHTTAISRVAVILVFAGIGGITLLAVHAATPNPSAEAESGILKDGATTVNDSMASGNGAVAFGNASPSIAFAKGAVWQTDDITASNGGSFDMTNSGVQSAVTKDAADMQNAGITWTRLWVDPGYDSASELQAVATIYRNHGISLDFNVNHGDTASAGNESTVESWLAVVVPQMAALGDHYWEIGNEPNINSNAGGYWDTCPGTNPSTATGQGNVSAAVSSYVTRLKDAYMTIHQYDPHAYVSSAGLSWDPSYNAYCEIPSAQWIAEFIKSTYSAWNYLDCFGIHPYDSSPSNVVADLTTVRGQLNASANFTNKPFCITEVGFWANGYTVGSQNGYIGSNSETTRAADYVTLMQDLKSYGISTPVFWYTWYDYSQADGYGIVHYGGLTSRTYLPIYTSMQNYQP